MSYVRNLSVFVKAARCRIVTCVPAMVFLPAGPCPSQRSQSDACKWTTVWHVPPVYVIVQILYCLFNWLFGICVGEKSVKMHQIRIFISFDTISEMRMRVVYVSLAVDVLKRNKTHLISQGQERFGRRGWGGGTENTLQAEDMFENLTGPCL